MAVIGLLGIVCSSSVIYFLACRKIKLAKCKHLFIINIAVSDVLVSVLGFVRGLGIIDSKFVGAPKNTATIQCEIYTICLNTLTNSGVLALIPLTIDRFIAIALPFKYRFIVTKKFSLFLITASWLPIVVSLLHASVAFSLDAIDIEYNEKYYRCASSGRYSKIVNIEEILLLMAPFFAIVVLHVIMLVFIIKNKLKFNRFLITAIAIIMTSLLAYFPTIIADIWDIPMSYEVSQVLTITLYYVNGIVNPVIHVLAHPATQESIRSWRENIRSSLRRLSKDGSGNKHRNVISNCNIVMPMPSAKPAEESV